MPENKYAMIRKRTGLTAYAFGGLLEQRGLGTRNHYYKYERGDAIPRVDLEDVIIKLNAELRGVPFNDVLLELRGLETEERPQLETAAV